MGLHDLMNRSSSVQLRSEALIQQSQQSMADDHANRPLLRVHHCQRHQFRLGMQTLGHLLETGILQYRRHLPQQAAGTECQRRGMPAATQSMQALLEAGTLASRVHLGARKQPALQILSPQLRHHSISPSCSMPSAIT